jgi:uncharacterized lipoprotein YmbA
MKLLRTLAAATLASLSAACGTTAPSRFFALTSLEPEAAQGETPASSPIESVRIAQYLQRPQMVRRTSSVEIEVDEYNRWAEPLDLALARVLEGDLRVLLGVQAASGMRASCTFTRFERDAQGRAVLEASFTLRGADPARAPLARTWIARRELAAPDDPAELAAALDGLVHDFARALAADIAAY